ncbi:MAG: DUF445 family protein [Acidobacteria bacterium]|nr:DUF445 family protein [Acidobacteriota bacterium]
MTLLVIIATFHGYGAAWLAVRMLFRPREPFKILGLTVFPQGMIPRHRERLANAIGKAVGEELVSQETIMDELLGKEFLHRKIREAVDAYTDDLLAERFPSLIEALPQSLREPVLDSITSLQFKVAEHIEELLASEASLKTVSSLVEKRVDDLLSRRVSEVVDENNFQKIVDLVNERIAIALRSPSLEEKIREFVGYRLDDLISSETPLGHLFTDDAVVLLKEKANTQVAPMAHHLTEIAAAERTRDQIGALIKKEVHQYYEALPFFKKIFVSRDNLLGEVDDLVNESLPKRIEETLKGDFFADEARSFINSSIDKAMARPLPEIIGTVDPEQLDRLKDQITRSIVSLLRGEAMTKQLSQYVNDTLERFRPHSLDSILRTIHPQAEEKLKESLSTGLIKVISRPETSRMINEMIARQIDTLLSAPIGKASDYISEEKLRSAGSTVADAIVAAIREKLPQAIRDFDVGGVVRQKIMTYPADKLEALILSVAKEHLRTIELFGAFLGLLIGLGQAAFHWFNR